MLEYVRIMNFHIIIKVAVLCGYHCTKNQLEPNRNALSHTQPIRYVKLLSYCLK